MPRPLACGFTAGGCTLFVQVGFLGRFQRRNLSQQAVENHDLRLGRRLMNRILFAEAWPRPYVSKAS